MDKIQEKRFYEIMLEELDDLKKELHEKKLSLIVGSKESVKIALNEKGMPDSGWKCGPNKDFTKLHGRNFRYLLEKYHGHYAVPVDKQTAILIMNQCIRLAWCRRWQVDREFIDRMNDAHDQTDDVWGTRDGGHSNYWLELNQRERSMIQTKLKEAVVVSLDSGVAKGRSYISGWDVIGKHFWMEFWEPFQPIAEELDDYLVFIEIAALVVGLAAAAVGAAPVVAGAAIVGGATALFHSILYFREKKFLEGFLAMLGAFPAFKIFGGAAKLKKFFETINMGGKLRNSSLWRAAASLRKFDWVDRLWTLVEKCIGFVIKNVWEFAISIYVSIAVEGELGKIPYDWRYIKYDDQEVAGLAGWLKDVIGRENFSALAATWSTQTEEDSEILNRVSAEHRRDRDALFGTQSLSDDQLALEKMIWETGDWIQPAAEASLRVTEAIQNGTEIDLEDVAAFNNMTTVYKTATGKNTGVREASAQERKEMVEDMMALDQLLGELDLEDIDMSASENEMSGAQEKFDDLAEQVSAVGMVKEHSHLYKNKNILSESRFKKLAGL